MRGAVIAKVTASKSKKYAVGTYVYASPGWTEQAILNDSSKEVQELALPPGGKPTDALGVLGK